MVRMNYKWILVFKEGLGELKKILMLFLIQLTTRKDLGSGEITVQRRRGRGEGGSEMMKRDDEAAR